MSSYKIGLQLYTVRDETARDFEGTLREVARLGYDGVEFAGYGGLAAEQLRELLDELKLEVAGTHVSYERLLEALDEEITYNKTIGNRYLIIPYMQAEKREDADSWKAIYANLQEIGARCAEQDMVLCYHNHEFEFLAEVDGTHVLDAMFEAVPASDLQMELDSCWAYVAGYDPVAYMHKYKGRLPLVHYKDMRRLEDGSIQTCELGAGEVPITAIAQAAEQIGAQWLIVEQDECQKPSLESVANNIAWIRQNLKVGVGGAIDE
ncbi:sugar phosphate isomerase/epimerase [Paenibacillus sp. N1-5-1-14]|uniref:sugar phosphate isomerase/epimerase family protein n=1 Tax=Paenibacillus radicibacter TaxID=2972488 RepID=UPI0021597881|nr:sugar phosphate isomerase/epimerase [Paenibacillus radicibacter]MCR8643160.1 sugar phosphate isomerase/epimerase [Paenibacillus radicibacter]